MNELARLWFVAALTSASCASDPVPVTLRAEPTEDTSERSAAAALGVATAAEPAEAHDDRAERDLRLRVHARDRAGRARPGVRVAVAPRAGTETGCLTDQEGDCEIRSRGGGGETAVRSFFADALVRERMLRLPRSGLVDLYIHVDAPDQTE
ncbi:MAG: hypothetical protein SangKO_035230 [Sandaracinaceae bacterium]|nr:hypothetical protein [Myxococcales bacterium]